MHIQDEVSRCIYPLVRLTKGMISKIASSKEANCPNSKGLKLNIIKIKQESTSCNFSRDIESNKDVDHTDGERPPEGIISTTDN